MRHVNWWECCNFLSNDRNSPPNTSSIHLLYCVIIFPWVPWCILVHFPETEIIFYNYDTLIIHKIRDTIQLDTFYFFSCWGNKIKIDRDLQKSMKINNNRCITSLDYSILSCLAMVFIFIPSVSYSLHLEVQTLSLNRGSKYKNHC